MLVLSRKEREAIRIGEEITVVIVAIRGDKVRVGVEAPPTVPVHRQEVYDAIKRCEPRKPPPAAPDTAADQTDGDSTERGSEAGPPV